MTEKLENLDIHLISANQVYSHLYTTYKLTEKYKNLDNDRKVLIFLKAVKASIRGTFKVSLDTLVFMYCNLVGDDYKLDLEILFMTVLSTFDNVTLYKIGLIPSKPKKKSSWLLEYNPKLTLSKYSTDNVVVYFN